MCLYNGINYFIGIELGRVNVIDSEEILQLFILLDPIPSIEVIFSIVAFFPKPI